MPGRLLLLQRSPSLLLLLLWWRLWPATSAAALQLLQLMQLGIHMLLQLAGRQACAAQRAGLQATALLLLL